MLEKIRNALLNPRNSSHLKTCMESQKGSQAKKKTLTCQTIIDKKLELLLENY